jgi:hypothetical protein
MKKLMILFLFIFTCAVFGQQKVNKNYIPGSDPVNIFALPKEDEEMRKYVGEEPVYATTNSGSGTMSLVELKPGFIFYNKIVDGKEDNIQEFTLAWCGNDSTKVQRFIGSNGKVLKRIPVDQTLLIPIKRDNDAPSDSMFQRKVIQYLKNLSENTDNLQNLVVDMSARVHRIEKATVRIEDKISNYIASSDSLRKANESSKQSFLSRWDWEWVVVGVALGTLASWVLGAFDAEPSETIIVDEGGKGPQVPNGPAKKVFFELFRVQLF